MLDNAYNCLSRDDKHEFEDFSCKNCVMHLMWEINFLT